MKEQVPIKKKCVLPIKTLWQVGVLSLAFCTIGVQKLTGQNDVEITVNGKELVIKYDDKTNKTNRGIVLFNQTEKISEIFKSDENTLNSFTKASRGKMVQKCGFTFRGKCLFITNHKPAVLAVDVAPKTIFYHYYELVDGCFNLTYEGKYILPSAPVLPSLSSREENETNDISTTTGTTETAKTETTDTEKPETKKTTASETKKSTKKIAVTPSKKIEKAIDRTKEYENKLTVFINQAAKAADDEPKLEVILQKTNQLKENIETEKSSIYDNMPVNYDELLTSYDRVIANIKKLENRIADGIVTEEIKKKYDAAVLYTVYKDSVTLDRIKTQINKKEKQSSLIKWIGTKAMKDSLTAIHTELTERSDSFIHEEITKQPGRTNSLQTLKNRIPEFYNEIEAYQKTLARITVPYIKLSLIGVLLLLLLFGISFYAKTILENKRIEKKKQEKRNTPEGRLLIEEEDTIEVISYKAGLSDVKEKVDVDYYKIDMLSISKDTSIRDVYFHRKAIVDVYTFFSDFLQYESKTNETGCFLVGRWEYVPNSGKQLYDISIDSLVEPGDDAVYGEYNLNFGAKIGITLNYAIENLCEKTGNEYVHTAWMHSHPGLGLFLSSQDLNVQSQLAYNQHPGRMLAIVIDSNTPDFKTAFFAPKQDGTMNNDNDLKKTISLKMLYQWAKK